MEINRITTLGLIIDYREFKEILGVLKMLQGQIIKPKDEKSKKISQSNFDAICERLEEIFDDRDCNLRRWLMEQDFVCSNPDTGKNVSISRSNGVDVLFTILVCCRRVNNNISVDPGTGKYLKRILRRDRCRVHEIE